MTTLDFITELFCRIDDLNNRSVYVDDGMPL